MEKINKPRISPTILILGILFLSFFGCTNDDNDEGKCHELVYNNPGYEIWAGDSSFYQIANNPDYFYNIDKHGYTLIGSSTTTQTFNTGNYKYYVIVAKYYTCIDAIRFNDGSYLGDGLYTGGKTEYGKMTGAPDGIFGIFGDRGDCIGSNTNNGFITEEKTILSRGGGMTVIVGEGCQ